MALTLGFTGMDSATEAALTAAFQQANTSGGNTWRLVPDADADNVVVDMDSMYGPMSWLRLHAAGKRVIGFTSAARTQADFHLARPLDAAGMAALLQQLAGGVAAAPPAANRARFAPTPQPPREPSSAATTPHPSGMSASPVPQDVLPEEHPLPINEEADAPGPGPRLPASVEAGTLAPTSITPAPVVVSPALPDKPTARPASSASSADNPAEAATPVTERRPARERHFADWLAPGVLTGRYRFRPAGAQPLWVDADARQYFSVAALKPLATVIDGPVTRDDFKPVDAATWARETAALGVPQPLNRLQWFGGLVAGKGTLMQEFDPAGRFKLSKWPQTEREFPKHFRIATAMMKGPATLEDIAVASGVPLADVTDFVNASLLTGYAEVVPDAVAEPVEPPKPSGLFGRLRGK